MVTDKQVRRLWSLMKKYNQVISAAKAGMAENTAIKYIKARLLPSQMKKERCWKTREDPFKEAWLETFFSSIVAIFALLNSRKSPAM